MRLARGAWFVLALAWLSLCLVAAQHGCGGDEDERGEDGRKAAAGKPKPFRTPPPCIRLTAVWTRAGAIQLKGYQLYTYVVKARAAPVGPGPVHPVARDAWLLLAYASGKATREELLQLARKGSWKAPPTEGFEAYNTKTAVDSMSFRIGLTEFKPDSLWPNRRTGPRRDFCYVEVLAPKRGSGKWDLREGRELVFPIKGYPLKSIDTLNALATAEYPHADGTAAVWPCGFDEDAGEQPALVVLGEPLLLRLDGAALSATTQPKPPATQPGGGAR